VRSALVAAATALVILGASILPFATPGYVRFEQDRTNVGATTGYSPADLETIAGSLLGDLMLWRGDFAVEAGGAAVLSDVDRAHMRDVRGVFTGLWILVLAGVAMLAFAFWRSRADARARGGTWLAVGRGAKGLLIAVVVLGALAAFAFDAMFELFHRLFFAEGSYTFDPATDHLVQLFPEQFWFETTMALGVVLVIVSIVVAWVASRRSRANLRRQPIYARSEPGQPDGWSAG
jgi:integral membrane protein (TIGR01906 family)